MQLGEQGEDIPSKVDFDNDFLRDRLKYTRDLRKAEEAMADVRARLRQHIPLSDVDSQVIPEPEEQLIRTLHLDDIRRAKGEESIRQWLDSFSEHELGPRPRDYLSGEDWTVVSPQISDTYSHREMRYYESNRARAYRRLQDKRLPRRGGSGDSLSGGSNGSRKRRRADSLEEGGPPGKRRQEGY